MRRMQRSSWFLSVLLAVLALTAACHNTAPTLLLEVVDPLAAGPTQFQLTIQSQDLDPHQFNRPESPGDPLESPQTLRLLLPADLAGRSVSISVLGMRDDEQVASASETTPLLPDGETHLKVVLIPIEKQPEPEVCDETTCPNGCCAYGVCIEGEFNACGTGGGACGACDAVATDSCTGGTCRCGPDGPCPPGYACEEAACVPTGEGQSCTSDTGCNTPPGQCFQSQGVCEENGKCSYAPLAAGEACEDGNFCTIGETCDGAGACGGGDARVCNTPGTCEKAGTGQCRDGACRYEPDEGASCGTEEACRTFACNDKAKCVAKSKENWTRCQSEMLCGHCLSGQCASACPGTTICCTDACVVPKQCNDPL